MTTMSIQLTSTKTIKMTSMEATRGHHEGKTVNNQGLLSTDKQLLALCAKVKYMSRGDWDCGDCNCNCNCNQNKVNNDSINQSQI